MIPFEIKDDLEDYLFWMFKVTYEIEMHLNAVFSLDRIISNLGLYSDQSMDMIFYHNKLALIQSAYLLKSKPKKDEKHSLFTLRNFLCSLGVKTNTKSLNQILHDIDVFYTNYEIDICKIINKRDAEAHEFKLSHQMKISNENYISINRQQEIIQIARDLITQVHYFLFKRDFPQELRYDVNIYDKIYQKGIN